MTTGQSINQPVRSDSNEIADKYFHPVPGLSPPSMPSPSLPEMLLVRQTFDCESVSDVSRTTRQELERQDFASKVKAGETVAITAGSRGISHLPEILKSVVDYFRSHNAAPLIVPAMGSHGSATAEGQVQVLGKLGITRESVGAEIRSSMDTVVVAKTPDGLPVYFDSIAAQADHVFVVNRIKPHTRFAGPIESGLHKMLLIGLGKHSGATVYHQAISDHSFGEILEAVAEQVIAQCSVLGGLAIVENALDQTAMIEAVCSNDFGRREPELLALAKQWLPTLPFPDVDLLIVDRIGKNISGTGMDANVIGRKFNDHAATEADMARCRRILVRSLTPETQGNACGIGMAEFTTQSCVQEIDIARTNTNVVTASHPEAGMIPLTYPSDAAAITAALQTVGTVLPKDARIIQISDTLHLTELRMSIAYFEEIEAATHLEIIDGPFRFPIDEQSRLADVC